MMPPNDKAKQLTATFQVHSDALLALDLLLSQVKGEKEIYWLEVRGIIEEDLYKLRADNRRMLSGSPLHK